MKKFIQKYLYRTISLSLCIVACHINNTLAEVFTAIDHIENKGVIVEFSVDNFKRQESTLTEGQLASIKFYAHDSASKAPIRGAYPAAWIHPKDQSVQDTLLNQQINDASCTEKTQHFIGSNLFSKAEVDLNTFHVLAMNDDATISVVDPLFGFGGSKLLHMHTLPSPAYDWIKTQSQRYVYASLPSTDQIVKLNTIDWSMEIQNDSKQWQQPLNITLQEKNNLLWAITKQGAAVFTAKPFAFIEAFPFDNHVNTMVQSNDENKIYFLTQNKNTIQSEIYIIESKNISTDRSTNRPNQTKVKKVVLNTLATAMNYSSQAQALYLSSENNGDITVIDGKKDNIVTHIQSESGIINVQFPPKGRLGFIINTKNNKLSILDTASNSIVQSAIVESKPSRIEFSDSFAYISHEGSETLLMIALDSPLLGKENEQIPAVDTPGGDSSAGLSAMPSPAAGIVQAPGSSAVLIANYHDQAIYYYKEGMAAPMGQFNNYGRSPRAVMTIDRSLKEVADAGVYQSSFTLPAAGEYDVVFFMDTPRINHCFTLTINESPLNQKTSTTPTQITDLNNDLKLTPKTTSTLHFSVNVPLQHPNKNATRNTLDISITSASGLWKKSKSVTPNNGLISFNFTPPMKGYFLVTVADRKFTYLVD